MALGLNSEVFQGVARVVGETQRVLGPTFNKDGLSISGPNIAPTLDAYTL